MALGYDEGTALIKIGREEPVASMDSSGKIIWAHHNEIQTVNVKSLGADTEDVSPSLVHYCTTHCHQCRPYISSTSTDKTSSVDTVLAGTKYSGVFGGCPYFHSIRGTRQHGTHASCFHATVCCARSTSVEVIYKYTVVGY